MLPIQNLPPEWQKTLKELALLATKMEFGEIVITIQDKKASVTSYTVIRKPKDLTDFQIKLLDD